MSRGVGSPIRPHVSTGVDVLGEYGLLELHAFVRQVIIPITYAVGRLLGKYGRFADAPAPV